MSFMTERYFQILENHKLYKMIRDETSLKTFVEHHVLCVWSYGFLMRNLYKDLVGRLEPLATQQQKEAQRLIAEMVVEEEFAEQDDGSSASHLELYIEAMQMIGADTGPTISLFDMYENGQDWKIGLQQSNFPSLAARYARCILSFAERPLHERAALLFYEGEPFIPDTFLQSISGISPGADSLVEYFEQHIEGLKKPGFSASGRLVELFCGDNETLNDEAEKAAELIMNLRIELFNDIAEKIEAVQGDSKQSANKGHLKLVTPDFSKKTAIDSAS
ncbi:MAG: DUF3050 domain-containing protein [Proteobacteria bacterium]|nr:MAG: DUF3050 domain-containing protein [Pseudomonadota bacterium]